MRRLIVVAILGLALGRPDAADAVWDWLPYAADDDKPCELHLRADAGWRISEPADALTRITDGQLHVTVTPSETAHVICTGPENRHVSVRLLPPGVATGLIADAEGRLSQDGDAIVLAVPRREAAADRRWGVLRVLASDAPEACSVAVPPPGETSWGTPALTRQVMQSQTIQVRNQAVLVQLAGADRLAAWKHREYRQTLAWLVMDLAARGATRIVLVEPAAPAVDATLVSPLRAQVKDVGTAFRCPVVSLDALDDPRYWEISPGVLGPDLNEAGRKALDERLRPWRR